MAGKLHTNLVTHSGGTQIQTRPGSRRVRAYAEGYNHGRNGGDIGGQPHPAGTPEAIAWGNGFADRAAARPPTHVGGT